MSFKNTLKALYLLSLAYRLFECVLTNYKSYIKFLSQISEVKVAKEVTEHMIRICNYDPINPDRCIEVKTCECLTYLILFLFFTPGSIIKNLIY